MRVRSRALAVSDRIYNLLLFAYPAPFRREYGIHMAQLFRDECRDTLRQAGRAGIILLWFNTLFIRLSGWGLVVAAISVLLTFLSLPESVGTMPFLFAILLITLGLLGLRACYGEQAGHTAKIALGRVFWAVRRVLLVTYCGQWGMKTAVTDEFFYGRHVRRTVYFWVGCLAGKTHAAREWIAHAGGLLVAVHGDWGKCLSSSDRALAECSLLAVFRPFLRHELFPGLAWLCPAIRRAAGDIHENAGHLHVMINTGCLPAGEVVPNDETHRHFGKAQMETELALTPASTPSACKQLTARTPPGRHGDEAGDRNYGGRVSLQLARSPPFRSGAVLKKELLYGYPKMDFLGGFGGNNWRANAWRISRAHEALTISQPQSVKGDLNKKRVLGVSLKPLLACPPGYGSFNLTIPHS